MAKKTPAKKSSARERAPQQVRDDVEVQAGLYALPTELPAELQEASDGPTPAEPGEPLPSHLLAWMLDDGTLLGSELGDPAELKERGGPAIRESFKQLPFLPGTLKIDSDELAEAFRPHISSRVAVRSAATPELDEAAEMVIDQILYPPTYFGENVEPAAIASFFAATARLYRARPWKSLREDDWLQVDIPELAISGYVLAVVGPRQEEPGWVLAPSPEDFELLQELDELAARREEEEDGSGDGEGEDEGGEAYPPVQFLSFQSRDMVAPALLDEIEEHGWETAGPKAVPYSATLSEDGELGDSGEDDFFQGEAISRALVDLLADTRELRRALDGDGAPLVARSVVEIGGEKVEVILTVPHPAVFEEDGEEEGDGEGEDDDGGDDPAPPEPEPARRRSGPAPAERDKTKSGGPASGSSRRKR